MLKIIALSLVVTIFTVGTVFAANYIEPQQLKALMDQKKPLLLIDIQPVADFELHHLPGSIETNAFPAKTEAEKKRLDKTLTIINSSKVPVVVICPRGMSGAKNSYAYLISKGIPESRLTILEDGIAEWPYKELFVKGR